MVIQLTSISKSDAGTDSIPCPAFLAKLMSSVFGPSIKDISVRTGHHEETVLMEYMKARKPLNSALSFLAITSVGLHPINVLLRNNGIINFSTLHGSNIPVGLIPAGILMNRTGSIQGKFPHLTRFACLLGGICTNIAVELIDAQKSRAFDWPDALTGSVAAFIWMGADLSLNRQLRLRLLNDLKAKKRDPEIQE